MPEMQHPRVAACPFRKARPDLTEQLGQSVAVLNLARNQTTSVQIATLGLRDQRLSVAAQVLGLLDGRFDAAVQEKRGRHVPKHRFPVLGSAPETVTFLVMPHTALLLFCLAPQANLCLCAADTPAI